MAVPSYTTDLIDIDTSEALGTWVETGTWSGGTAPVLESDFFIQGSNCIAKYLTSGGVAIDGFVMNYGTGITIPSPGGLFIWMMGQCPNNMATEANGGLRAIIGSSSTAFNAWAVKGSDTYTFGGWFCAVVDPAINGGTPDYTVGSPTSTKQWFGGAFNPLATAKGGTGIDVMRYGRGEAKIANGSTTDGYATFSGFAAQNDNTNNRWGLIQAIDGGYLWQGLMSLGLAASATDFRDSNTLILINNTKKVISTFNKIEINNVNSRVDWTNINFLALGTVSRGNFECINNADVNLNSCSFTDMGTFIFQANSTINNTTFRRTDRITTGGAAFNGCVIDSNRASSAMLASAPSGAALISNTAFTWSASGHAIEIGGIAANITLTGNTYSGYASGDGSTGNECIYVNIASGSMSITINGGGYIPTIRTAGCSVTIISGAVNATVTVKNLEGSVISDARTLVLAASGGPFPYNSTVTMSSSAGTTTVNHTSHGMATNDKVQIKGANEQEYNGVYTITKTDNNTYTYPISGSPASPATGSIKATFVVLSGLTDTNGQITMSRVFLSNQPITGRIRKSTGTPVYKTSTVLGTVDSSTGFSTTVQLIPDE